MSFSLNGREPLQNGTVLLIHDEYGQAKEFRIEALAGAGSSCLVYKALEKDPYGSGAFDQNVIIKEFYPSGMGLKRDRGDLVNENGNRPNSLKYFDSLKAFQNGLKEQSYFYEAYSDRSLPRVRHYGAIHNTCYGILDGFNGSVLTDYVREHELSVYETLSLLKGVCECIRCIHREEKVYLDCKPENIYVTSGPGMDPKVFFFDFSSVLPLNDLKEARMLSYSSEWAAPEVKNHEMDRIGYHSDCYSIGLLLFWMLTKGQLSYGADEYRADMDSFAFAEKNLGDIADPTVKEKILKMGMNLLQNDPSERTGDIDTLINNIDDLKQMTEPTGQSIGNAINEIRIRIDNLQAQTNTLNSLLNKERESSMVNPGVFEQQVSYEEPVLPLDGAGIITLMSEYNNDFLGKDENGIIKRFVSVFTFDSDETGKHYVAYTDETLDANGDLMLYAASLDLSQTEPRLAPIETVQEYETFRDILSQIYKEYSRPFADLVSYAIYPNPGMPAVTGNDAASFSEQDEVMLERVSNTWKKRNVYRLIGGTVFIVAAFAFLLAGLLYEFRDTIKDGITLSARNYFRIILLSTPAVGLALTGFAHYFRRPKIVVVGALIGLIRYGRVVYNIICYSYWEWDNSDSIIAFCCLILLIVMTYRPKQCILIGYIACGLCALMCAKYFFLSTSELLFWYLFGSAILLYGYSYCNYAGPSGFEKRIG